MVCVVSTISIDYKAGNFASHLDWCILVSAILKFCFLSSETYLFFKDFSLLRKVVYPFVFI